MNVSTLIMGIYMAFTAVLTVSAFYHIYHAGEVKMQMKFVGNGKVQVEALWLRNVLKRALDTKSEIDELKMEINRLNDFLSE